MVKDVTHLWDPAGTSIGLSAFG